MTKVKLHLRLVVVYFAIIGIVYARLQSIDLGTAVRFALARNFLIKESLINSSISAYRITEAFGVYEPVLRISELQQQYYQSPGVTSIGGFLDASYYRARNQGLSIVGSTPWGLSYNIGMSEALTNDPSTYGFNRVLSDVGVSIDQPLARDFGRAANYKITVARAEKEKSILDYKLAVSQVLYDTILSYNELWYALQVQHIQRESRDRARELVMENMRRHKDGSMAQSDVDSARARASAREEDVVLADEHVKMAEDALQVLIGGLTEPQVGLVYDVIPPPAAEFEDLEEQKAILVAISSRPEAEQARLGVKRASIDLKYSENQLLPRVDIVGSYGFNGYGRTFIGSRLNLLHNGETDYSVGFKVEIPLSLAAEKAKVRENRLSARQATLLRLDVQQQIVAGVRAALIKVNGGRTRIRVTAEALRDAELSLKDEEEKLRNGITTTFVVLSLQETLSAIKIRLVRAQTDLNEASTDLDLQMGKILDRWNVSVNKM